MSGPSDHKRFVIATLVLFMVAGGFSGGVSAQYLPDIREFEVEDVRLILLDADGKRRGVLEGEKARKQRDGSVLVESATLTFTRDNDEFKIVAPEFSYEPDTSKFKAPEGVTATLPDDGELILPEGEGEISYGDNVKFTMDVDGEGKMRSGVKGQEFVNASIINPTIIVELTPTDGEFELTEFKVEGGRGGSLQLRLEHLPSFKQPADDASGAEENKREGKNDPALVTVSCFGDVELRIFNGGEKATLSMARRASMKLEQDEQGVFEVTSTRLIVSGNIVRNANTDDEPEQDEPPGASLTDLAIDASQNVRLTGNEFDGSAGVLRYREFTDRREVRLLEDAELTLQQGVTPDGESQRINLRAKVYVDVLIPFETETTEPDAISVSLLETARVARFVGESQQWKITGRMVRLFSWRGSQSGGSYNHAFDAYAEGFSPILRVSPENVRGDRDGTPTPEGQRVERAAIYGARADGTFIDDRMNARIYGPEVLGIIDSDAPLADLFRVILGLQKQARDKTGRLIPPKAREGRLTIRAEQRLDVELLTSSASGNLSVSARGRVELDHQPLPRDDRNLVTLTGNEVDIEIRGGEIKRARVDTHGENRALATLGFDLLQADNFDIRTSEGGMTTNIEGPGRMVVRDEKSVDYFQRELDRLPKRSGDHSHAPDPDAAWLNFGASLNIRTQGLTRRMEGDDPDFHLVRGDFEDPRAGRSSVNDLDELHEPEVVTLYVIQARRLFARQVQPGSNAVPVNVLRLEGDPFVDSELDGIRIQADDAIELSGAENQRTADAPFSIVLFSNAKVTVNQAGVFFGEYVTTGSFSYDDAWTLGAKDRLEVTLRPLEFGNEPGSLAKVRELIGHSLNRANPLAGRVHALEQARKKLAGLVDADTKSTDPAVLQPVNALPKLDAAIRHARMGAVFTAMQNSSRLVEIERMEMSARRARSLLSGLIDVAGSGGVEGEFISTRSSVPPLTLKMNRALFTFNGLGSIVDVDADGPIVVSRESYTVRGDRLTHSRDGALTLDGASITLPEDTGVSVGGMTSVSLRQRDNANMDKLANGNRTMVTRVTGKNLEVEVDLTANDPEKD